MRATASARSRNACMRQRLTVSRACQARCNAARQRLRTVSSNSCSPCEIRNSTARLGGSSSVFSTALAPNQFISSTASMIATRHPPMAAASKKTRRAHARCRPGFPTSPIPLSSIGQLRMIRRSGWLQATEVTSDMRLRIRRQLAVAIAQQMHRKLNGSRALPTPRGPRSDPAMKKLARHPVPEEFLLRRRMSDDFAQARSPRLPPANSAEAFVDRRHHQLPPAHQASSTNQAPHSVAGSLSISRKAFVSWPTEAYTRRSRQSLSGGTCHPMSNT